MTITDQLSVLKATENWRDTVTSNTDDAPKKTAALYAPDALFWGTVSEQVRTTPQHVREYFVSGGLADLKFLRFSCVWKKALL